MRIGINGFGRIGRQAFRNAFEQEDIEVVHINDVADAATLAYLLQLDTTYGRWPRHVRGSGQLIAVDGREITVSAEKDPSRLPWGDKRVDVVLESTGVFRKRDDARKHLDAGARKVLVSAPGKSPLDGDFVIGVNDEQYAADRHQIISIGSCTTNCLAVVAKVLHEELGIEHGLVNTVHAYTSDQQLLDGPHKSPRRGRSAAENLVPTTTGAAQAIGAVMPELDGKLDGLAVRAPVKCGSLLDLTCSVARETNAAEVNDALRRWAEGRMQGVLSVEELPVVSSDVIGTEHSAIVSPDATHVIGERMVKVLAWYDNEWAFSRRCVDMMKRML